MKKFKILLLTALFLSSINLKLNAAGEQAEPIKIDWSFKGLTGKFDRSSL